MLSEEERQELLALARSSAIREEFRRLRSPYVSPSATISADALATFLTAMSRMLPATERPRPVAHDVAWKI